MVGEGFTKMDRLQATVIGQVQGVGFRYFVKRYAESLSLTGFVRNLPEGQVEVVAEGAPDALDQLTKLLSIGPSGAVVYDVIIQRSPGTGEFPTFIIVV
jgi:acylphosphatase